MTTLTPGDLRAVATIRGELRELVRYDDESIVHTRWVRQRYDCGCYPSFAPARQAAVRTAWHEAGHAVAALAIGARFSSASIHHGHRTEGRVHGITGAGWNAFVVDAAGQIGEQLMTWTLLERDADLQAWLSSWRGDGGDARRFRQTVTGQFAGDEVAGGGAGAGGGAAVGVACAGAPRRPWWRVSLGSGWGGCSLGVVVVFCN